MRLMNSIPIRSLLAMSMSVIAIGCDNSESGSTPSGSGANAPTPQVAEQTKATAPATQPIIPVAQMKDWCPEHSMPESICVQCNASLAAGFKAKGDWDEKHSLPKSQCFQCDPSLKEKFAAAYKEKYGSVPPTEGGDDHGKSKTP